MNSRHAKLTFGAKANRWSIALLWVSSLILVLAFVVLLGWQLHAQDALQVLPGLGPMRYSTALGLICLAAAALGMLKGVRVLVGGGGIVAALLGASALIAHFAPELGNADLLLDPSHAGTSIFDVGRPALPTAISLFFSGTAMAAFALRRSYAPLGVLNSVTLGFALMSLIGDAFNATYLAPYSGGASMATDTAFALLMYAIVVLGYAWTREDVDKEGLPKWAPWLCFSIAPALFYAAQTLIPDTIETANLIAFVIAIGVCAKITFAIRKLMTVSLGTKGLLLVAIPSILLLAFSGLIANIDRQSKSDEAWVLHSTTVSEASQRLLTTVTQAESATRSYLLTRNPNSVQSYPALLQSSDDLNQQIEQLVTDNPVQEGQAIKIRSLTSQRMLFLSAVVATVRSADEPAIAKIISEGAGPVRGELLAALESFSREEQRLGVLRDSALQNSWRQTNKLLVSGVTGALLLSALLATAFSGAMTRRIKTIQENVRRLREGRALVDPIAGGDEIAHLDAGFHELANVLNLANQKEAELRQQAQLRTSELQRFRSAMDASAEAIFLTDRATGLFVEVNATALAMTGYGRKELLSMGISALTENDDLEDLEKRLSTAASVDGLELRMRQHNGQLLDVELHIVVAFVDDVWIEVTVAHNITERNESRRRLEKFAHYDALTNLPNRTLFFESLERTLVQAARTGFSVLVMSIDIDQFKVVNDSHGQVVGDLVLRMLADRLLRSIRIRDLAARLGGDQLATVLVLDDDSPDPTFFANKILEAIRLPFDINGADLFITASIGLSIFPDDANEAEEMVRQAQVAMYGAKESGRDTFQFYTAQKNLDALARAELIAALKLALINHEFILYYQPQIRINGNQIAGVEALLRWDRPGHGLVAPACFIPILEESGLIVEVGRWVLLQACHQIKRWTESSFGPLQIAVNVSGRQFTDSDMVKDVMTVLEATQIAPALLELELTESSLMANTESTISTLKALKALGVGISIDDFGTGFSSLAYLRRFPIDRLKIDIAFVREITTNPEDAAIAIAIIHMAHSLKLDVVAEGVENEAQLTYLRRHFCDSFQGYHFSRPLGIEALEALFTTHAQRSLDDRPSLARDTILLVDDDASVRESLGHILENEGYRVIRASSAEEGFEQLALNEVQVILCDQRMPGTTGVEFFDRVKDLHPKTFRIILSGFTDPESILDSINRGAVYRYHTKPVNIDLLLSDLRMTFRHYRLLHAEASPIVHA